LDTVVGTVQDEGEVGAGCLTPC